MAKTFLITKMFARTSNKKDVLWLKRLRIQAFARTNFFEICFRGVFGFDKKSNPSSVCRGF